jgi:hypothetical protein
MTLVSFAHRARGVAAQEHLAQIGYTCAISGATTSSANRAASRCFRAPIDVRWPSSGCAAEA